MRHGLKVASRGVALFGCTRNHPCSADAGCDAGALFVAGLYARHEPMVILTQPWSGRGCAQKKIPSDVPPGRVGLVLCLLVENFQTFINGFLFPGSLFFLAE